MSIPLKRMRRRRGVAAVIAMVFLVLFTTLAVGFYSATNTAVQVSQGEQRVDRALLAAESGLAYLRTWLNTVGAQGSQAALYAALNSNLASTPSMNGHDPTLTTVTVNGVSRSAILIPGATTAGASVTYNWLPLSTEGDGCRIAIWYNGATPVAHVVGQSVGSSTVRPQRAFEYSFNSTGGFSGTGLMSKSALNLSNGISIYGDVTSLSTDTSTPSLTIGGGAMIHGNFNYMTGAKAPSYAYGGASTFITGSVTPMTNPPSMPTVDTSPFVSWVPSATATGSQVINSSNAGLLSTYGTKLANIRIKANTNPSIGNGAIINGVIYLESPNTLTIGGGCTVKGVIVTDGTAPISPLPAVGSLTSVPSSCAITIGNGASISDMSTLVAGDIPSGMMPSGKTLAMAQAMGGACVLAPYYSLTFNGGSTTTNGTLAASSFSLSNGYTGTIAGALLNLSPTTYNQVGGTVLHFLQGSTSATGITAPGALTVLGSSYAEVTP